MRKVEVGAERRVAKMEIDALEWVLRLRVCDCALSLRRKGVGLSTTRRLTEHIGAPRAAARLPLGRERRCAGRGGAGRARRRRRCWADQCCRGGSGINRAKLAVRRYISAPNG
eukprot:scaffold13320_cov118-Isochrysis_galbana.AAC.6